MMFTSLGNPRGTDRSLVVEKLDAMIHSPWEWWMRAYRFPVPSAQAPQSLQRFTAPEDAPYLPAQHLERWVEFFLDRAQYRCAWALIAWTYFGERRLPSLDFVQWDGFPHRSRLWVFDDQRSALLPVPEGGPTARALGLWYALNGGPFAQGTVKPDFGRCYVSWTSISGPYYGHPWDNLTAEAAWARLALTFTDLRGHGHATQDALRVPPPGAEIRGGVAYVRGAPLMRTRAEVGTEQGFGEWGEEWLEGLEGLPDDILQEALELRRAARGTAAPTATPRKKSERFLTEGSPARPTPSRRPTQSSS